jgi:hypothetical protein
MLRHQYRKLNKKCYSLRFSLKTISKYTNKIIRNMQLQRMWKCWKLEHITELLGTCYQDCCSKFISEFRQLACQWFEKWKARQHLSERSCKLGQYSIGDEMFGFSSKLMYWQYNHRRQGLYTKSEMEMTYQRIPVPPMQWTGFLFLADVLGDHEFV